MNILVTGAKGFVGKNLCAQLKNIRDGKARCYGDLVIDEVFEFDIDSTLEELDEYCKKADFVFNLAGVNRPKDQSEFMAGNFGFASTLLDTLKKYKNTCPVMLSSSQQASLTGRFGNSEYGRSKKAGEDLFLDYERDFLLNQELENSRINATDSDDPESNNKQFSNSQILDNKGLRPRVLIYRFPNLFGKWCRPNYNSAVATFCNAFANDLPYTVNDPSVELELLYIDDLVDEMIACLKGQEHRCDFNGLEVIPYNSNKDQELENLRINSANGDDSESTNQKFSNSQILDNKASESSNIISNSQILDNQPSKSSEIISNSQILDEKRGRYCYVPTTHKATLGHIVELLKSFSEQPKTLMIPEIPENSFAKKLYSTYLSYLPKEKAIYDLKMNVDARGSFTELVHTEKCGQVSINISKPGITKGQHWHNTKWELFIVVAGHGLIQLRKEGTDEVLNYEVSGDKIQAVHMLPGYTHNIINLSDTEDLVTVMYCNEIFNPNKPDTYFDPV